MLIRWKNKDKQSASSTSAAPTSSAKSSSKKKRKFGRGEGESMFYISVFISFRQISKFAQPLQQTPICPIDLFLWCIQLSRKTVGCCSCVCVCVCECDYAWGRYCWVVRNLKRHQPNHLLFIVLIFKFDAPAHDTPCSSQCKCPTEAGDRSMISSHYFFLLHLSTSSSSPINSFLYYNICFI